MVLKQIVDMHGAKTHAPCISTSLNNFWKCQIKDYCSPKTP